MANPIHSLRAASRWGWATIVVPTPGTPASASATTRSRSAAAITVRTPDELAIWAAANLEAMPPLPRSVPAPPAAAANSASTLRSVISPTIRASASVRGSAVWTPSVSVNSTSRSAPTM